MHRPVFRLALLVTLVAVATPALAQRDSRQQPQKQTSKRQSASDYATAEQRKGTAATQVAARLRSDYRQRTDRLAPILTRAGYTKPQVMHALLAEGMTLDLATQEVGRNKGGPPAAGSGSTPASETEEMAETLRAGDYSAEQVAEVLVTLYGSDAKDVAGALKYAGYGVAPIARALRVEFGVDDAAAIGVLHAAGFSCNDAWLGVTTRSSGFQGSATDRVVGLYEAGCSRNAVRGILENGSSKRALADWLARLLEP